MRGLRFLAIGAAVWCAAGCAASFRSAGHTELCALAQMPEGMCKHCNCLMPAGLAPEATCPVCKCGRQAHACVRGR